VRLSTIHQLVVGGAAVGAALLCLYATSLAWAGRGSSWIALAVASALSSVVLALYVRRFHRTHR
jgi:hypothetical protein